MSIMMKKTVIFAGGGTVGPVTPLLAIYDEMHLRRPDLETYWAGTMDGPERKLVASRNIAFYGLPVVKIDRFLSLRNLLMPFKMGYACFKALGVLKKTKPDLIITAGGFVAVPLVWMGKLKRIPTHIHQLDIRPGLANKLCSPFAKQITVTFEHSLKDYSKAKTIWTGGPVRQEIFRHGGNQLRIDPTLKTIFIFGGGTGASAINQLVWGALDELTKYAQVIHLTGKGKGKKLDHSRYYQYEFFANEMPEAYHRADIVVTRAGLGTFLELAALKKAAVIIPIPHSHQEDNAQVFADADIAHVLDQNQLSPQLFASHVLNLLNDQEKRAYYEQRIGEYYQPDAVKRIVEKIEEILYSKASTESKTNEL